MPFIWPMANTCLEMPYGAIRHFPAGSYYDQTQHWTGEVELALMQTVHSAWYVFGHLKKSEWKLDQTKFFDWLRKEPPPVPSHRLDMIINWLWQVSAYSIGIMESIRLAKPN